MSVRTGFTLSVNSIIRWKTLAAFLSIWIVFKISITRRPAAFQKNIICFGFLTNRIAFIFFSVELLPFFTFNTVSTYVISSPSANTSFQRVRPNFIVWTFTNTYFISWLVNCTFRAGSAKFVKHSEISWSASTSCYVKDFIFICLASRIP